MLFMSNNKLHNTTTDVPPHVIKHKSLLNDSLDNPNFLNQQPMMTNEIEHTTHLLNITSFKMQPPLITSNETIQNTTINGVIKKFSRANRAATGATALVLVLIGFMFFLLFCYVLGRCAGRTSDKEGNSKRSRRRGKRNNLDLTEQQRRQNEVLHQKRIYEIQHEEGLHNMPPSLDEISDEDLVVPLPGAVAHSKSSDLENGNCLPHVALAESKSDGKVNHEITNDTQSKPKNKAVELLMRKVTTVEVPKSAINVIHKKEMIQKRIAAEAAKRAEEEASATLVMA